MMHKLLSRKFGLAGAVAAALLAAGAHWPAAFVAAAYCLANAWQKHA